MCSARGTRVQWCRCACCGDRGSWLRHATAAEPVTCGPVPAGHACAALQSRATPLCRPPTAALPGAGSTLQASSPLPCEQLPDQAPVAHCLIRRAHLYQGSPLAFARTIAIRASRFRNILDALAEACCAMWQGGDLAHRARVSWTCSHWVWRPQHLRARRSVLHSRCSPVRRLPASALPVCPRQRLSRRA